MRNTKTMKGIAAAALALSLVAAPAVQEFSPLFSGTSLGVVASAVEPTEVATITDLQTAIANATAGDTIKLTATGELELTAGTFITVDKDLTIDLGEAVIKCVEKGTWGGSGYGRAMLNVTGTANVTLKGGSLKGNNVDTYVISTADGTSLTIEGTAIENDTGDDYYNTEPATTKSSVIASRGNLTLKGAKVKSGGASGAVKVDDGKLTVDGGQHCRRKEAGYSELERG